MNYKQRKLSSFKLLSIELSGSGSGYTN